jgi:hypothetical protein
MYTNLTQRALDVAPSWRGLMQAPKNTTIDHTQLGRAQPVAHEGDEHRIPAYGTVGHAVLASTHLLHLAMLQPTVIREVRVENSVLQAVHSERDLTHART